MAHCCWCNLMVSGLRISTNGRPWWSQYWPIRGWGCLPHLAQPETSNLQSSQAAEPQERLLSVSKYSNYQKLKKDHSSNVVTIESTIEEKGHNFVFFLWNDLLRGRRLENLTFLLPGVSASLLLVSRHYMEHAFLRNAFVSAFTIPFIIVWWSIFLLCHHFCSLYRE